MENKDTQLIEQYFAQQLPEADKIRFEQRLAEDADFREAVRVHGLALEAIRQGGREAMKQQLRERVVQDPERSKKRFRFLWAAGSVLVLTFGVMWWKNQQESPLENTPQAIPPAAAPSLQPVPAPAPPVADDPGKPAPSTPAGVEQRLFAAHFQAFQSEELNGMIRAAAEESPFHSYADAYVKGQYAEALRRFEQLSKEDQDNASILFLKANALLATGQTDAAVRILDRICKEKSSRYVNSAQWYLALARLKQGDWKNAKAMFTLIKNTPVHPYAARAEQVLSAYSSSTKPAQKNGLGN